MPVSHHFVPPLLFLTGEGDYDADELKRGLRAALDDPACPPAPGVVLDVIRSTRLVRRPAEEIADLARFAALLADRFGNRMAVVTSAPGTAAFGLVRMGAVSAEAGGLVVEAFGSREAAVQWLTGVPPTNP